MTGYRPLCLLESVERRVGVWATGYASSDDIRSDARIGDAVATKAEYRPAIVHSWDATNEWQTRRAGAERTCPNVIGPRVQSWEETFEFAPYRLDLPGQQAIANTLVRAFLVLAAADDAAISRRANIEVGFGCLPKECPPRPQPVWLWASGHRECRDDAVASTLYGVWQFVACSVDKVPTTDLIAASRGRYHPAPLHFDINDMAAGVKRRTIVNGCAKIASRKATRIGRKFAMTQKRTGPRNAELNFEGAGVEILSLESGVAARFALSL